jgi:hypothetical protein
MCSFYPVGTRGSFPGGKASGADHSPPASAEVNAWSYTSINTPSWRDAKFKKKDRDNFNL